MPLELPVPSRPVPSARYFFAYSIRYSLQAEEQQRASGAEVVHGDVQLRTRQWLIRDQKGIVTGEVRGEGVIGLYPHLKAGQGEFRYQSCTHQETVYGSMEGAFTFAPGTLAEPKGRDFDATCARFPLDVPEFIY